MFNYFSSEERVPAKHPLRSIKAYTDSALKQIRPVLDGIYSTIGRLSIPPERLLKAQLLTTLYSVCSDRLFCETLDYNNLFCWFLDMSLDEPSFDASKFSKNRERLAGEDVALRHPKMRGQRKINAPALLTFTGNNLVRTRSLLTP